MEFHELETIIASYLTLADDKIVKLLCAAVIANRIPQLDPTWLFIVSSSSGGKSELLAALSHAKGLIEQDDLTSKALISGAKSHEYSTSLLERLPDDAVLVIKDLTVLLKKDPRESDQIFSTLRMVYDGKVVKSFGTGEDKVIPVRMGLIAGVTSEIEDHQTNEAAVGQRAIKYYMRQPPEDAIDSLTARVINGRKDREMRATIGAAFKEFLDVKEWAPTELPDLSEEIRADIALLSGMATKARSSIKRKVYSRDNPIERKNLREMPFRMAKQLANLARALIIMNGGELLPIDKKILYQIALDSIPSSRKEVMMAATKYENITLEGLAGEMKLPPESAKIHLDDLIALELMIKSMSYGNKFQYSLFSKYRLLISKFENIVMTTKILGDEVPLPTEY